MICSNILSQDSHLIVNMVVAHNFGLNTAVYWASLSEILPRVRRKNTIDENGFFSIDREYVTKRTTLSVTDQRACDDLLVAAGIMRVDESNPDRISLDSVRMLSYIVEGDLENLPKNPAIILTSKTTSKRSSGKSTKAKTSKSTLTPEQKEERFKYAAASVHAKLEEPDPELSAAYLEWCTALMGKKGMNSVTAQTFKDDLDAYTSDKTTKLEILKIAAAKEYNQVAWAIQTYERLVASGAYRDTQKSVTTVGLDSNISF